MVLADAALSINAVRQSRDSLSDRLHAVIKEPEKRHFIGIPPVRGGARLSAPELNADKTPADVKEVNEMKHSAPTGLVSLMLVAVSGIPAAADELTKTRFIQLDANRDGYLTQHEIRTQPESSRWLQISTYGSFTLADVNSDGQVDEAEFSAFEQALPVE